MQCWIVLRTGADRTLRLRRQPQTHVLVHVGDAIEAGEPLTRGERNHRALLHAWGEDLFGEHLRSELAHILDDSIPRAYLGLVLRAMLRGGQLCGMAELARTRRGHFASDRPVQAEVRDKEVMLRRAP